MTVIFEPATSPGDAVPVPPLATGTVPVSVAVPKATVNPAPVAPPVNVPTEVRDEARTFEARVAPVSVPAAAAMVPDAPRETAVPFSVTLELAKAELGIAVKPEPMEPLVRVPTPVSDELTTLDASAVPVSVEALTLSEPVAAIV